MSETEDADRGRQLASDPMIRLASAVPMDDFVALKAYARKLQQENAELIEANKQLQEHPTMKPALMGKVNIVCPECHGLGYRRAYVGCDCTRLEPYDKIVCARCHGKGTVIANALGPITTEAKED